MEMEWTRVDLSSGDLKMQTIVGDDFWIGKTASTKWSEEPKQKYNYLLSYMATSSTVVDWLCYRSQTIPGVNGCKKQNWNNEKNWNDNDCVLWLKKKKKTDSTIKED